MTGSPTGARAAAAARLGMSTVEYHAHLAAGLKWCTRCEAWHPRDAFCSDKSRSDGLSSVCRDARAATSERPGMKERRQRAQLGLAWCRRCEAWLPADEVRSGICRPHANAEARLYYAAQAREVTRRKVARRRGLAPTPEWWREDAFERFGGLCAYGCGRSAYALDHVIPVARGGESRPDNLVPACTPCNSSKKDSDPRPWIERGYLAFPGEWTDLIALSFVLAGSLEEVA